MSYYGLSHRYYARPLAGWPPAQFPRGVRGLGAGAIICLDQSDNSISCSDPNCTWGDCGSTGPQLTSGALCLDQTENQIACADPNCTHGDCISAPATTPTQAGGAAGAPTGAVLQYVGTWQTPTSKSVTPAQFSNQSDSAILQAVSQNLPGLQITQQSSNFSTLQSYLIAGQDFQVTLTLQVTGPGFASPQDAKAVVDHAYYIATGSMPVNSAITLQSATWPTGSPLPGTLPAGMPPPAGSSAGSSWLSSIFGSGAAGAGTSSSSSQMSQLMLPLLILFGILMIEK